MTPAQRSEIIERFLSRVYVGTDQDERTEHKTIIAELIRLRKIEAKAMEIVGLPPEFADLPCCPTCLKCATAREILAAGGKP